MPFLEVRAAHDEAEALWEDGEFKPPIRVHDDRSMLEGQLWSHALQDVEKSVWIRGPAGIPSAFEVELHAMYVLEIYNI